MTETLAGRYQAIVDRIRADLFPVNLADTKGWIEENIGTPEFEWDEETVCVGFLRPANGYALQNNPYLGGAITAALIEGRGRSLNAMASVVAASERVGIAARALEDLLFKFRARPEARGLGDLYDGVIAGSITSTFLGQMHSIFLRKNPLGIDKCTLLRLYSYCSRETARSRYMAGSQLGWMKDKHYQPQMAHAIQYAKYGPMGSALRVSAAMAETALGVPEAEQRRTECVIDELSVITAVWQAARDASEESYPHEKGEDFRVGKITPLTVLATQQWGLCPIKIWELRSVFSVATILEDPLKQAGVLLDEHAEKMRALSQRISRDMALPLLRWAAYLGEDLRRLAAAIKAGSRPITPLLASVGLESGKKSGRPVSPV